MPDANKLSVLRREGIVFAQTCEHCAYWSREGATWSACSIAPAYRHERHSALRALATRFDMTCPQWFERTSDADHEFRVHPDDREYRRILGYGGRGKR